METLLRLQINGFCLAVILILRLSANRRKFSKTGADLRIFGALLLSTAAMLFLDAAGWLLDGSPGAIGRAVVLVVDGLYYAAHTLPALFFILYADFQVFRDEGRFTRVARPFIIIAVLVAFAAALSIFTGILFHVDGENRYVRGAAFPVFAVLEYGIAAYALVFLIRSFKKVSRRVFITLLTYPLVILVAAILQMYIYGFVLIWPAMTLFLVASSANIENRRARTDYLTGTANRRSLDEELERRIAVSKSGKSLCGLLIDLDDFKNINDRFGHEAGDRALEDIALILLSSVRVEDMVARMGGDEFVILIDFKEPTAMEDLVGRVEAAVENHNASELRPYRLALSIGRACYDPVDGGSAAEFLGFLDSDMYARKKSKSATIPKRGRLSKNRS
jgi:diguanylate cyclase (GGDEF)-like protein